MQNSSLTAKLILGTAQFGLKYGINNTKGKPTDTSVDEIFENSLREGIRTLDTADAYGNAIDQIGKFHEKSTQKFEIITKFKDVGEEFSFDYWLESTLEKMNIEMLFCSMFHSTNDYFTKPHLLDLLLDFCNKGLVKYIGVSIYTNEQFEKVIDDPSVQLIQLPYNLLDNMNQRGDLIKKAKANNKIIHVRSVFLQGLFFMDIDKLPIRLKPLKAELEYLQHIVKESNISMQTLALKYVASNTDIDGILIGVDNINQLQDNIESLNMKIPQTIINHINSISTQHLELLNPVNWA